MTKVLNVVKLVWAFMKTKTFLYVLFGAMFVSVISTCSTIRGLKQQVKNAENNTIAMGDSVKVEKNKNGQYQSEINGYVSTIKNLKIYNKQLYDEVLTQKGKVVSLNHSVISLVQDTTELRKQLSKYKTILSEPIELNDSTYSISWVLSYDWDENNFDVFGGNTIVGIKTKSTKKDILFGTDKLVFNELFSLTHIKSEITKRESQIELIFGQRIEDDKLRIFVKSNYPGLTTKSLSGVLIDPQNNNYLPDIIGKKRKLFPNTWTVGIGPSVGYNLTNNSPYVGFGVNISYNLYQW